MQRQLLRPARRGYPRVGPSCFAIFANAVLAFYVNFCTFLGILKGALSDDTSFERKFFKKFLRVPRARCLYASEHCGLRTSASRYLGCRYLSYHLGISDAEKFRPRHHSCPSFTCKFFSASFSPILAFYGRFFGIISATLVCYLVEDATGKLQ